MKQVVPNYYEQFECVGGKCVDNCCRVGWQIQLDSKTCAKYNKLNDKYINSNIEKADKKLYIKMVDKCCPFLREDGLCNLIANRGDEYICETCRNHPRFFNYLNDRTEIGLGLCCEEVCRLFLNQDGLTTFVVSGSGGKLKPKEKADYSTRQQLFDIISQNVRDFVLCKDMLCKYLNIKGIDFRDILSKCKFEFLSDEYSQIFDKAISGEHTKLNEINGYSSLQLCNLLIYFLYRYSFANNYKFSSQKTILAFAIVCTDYIVATNGIIQDKLLSIKDFSKEFEYCEENIQKIINVLEKEFLI